MKKIGIITSGGDCGGLNAVIKGAAQMAHKRNISCYIIPNGYAGLYNLVDFDSLVELKPERIDMVQANPAGSEAGHSRVKIKNITEPGKYERIKQGLKKFGIDGLIISGGDDTGSVIIDLSNNGISCVHAPKTMDLDLQTYSVGADSTINRIAAFGQDLKTTGRTHNRIIVLEVFGRYAGHTAFRGGIAADADSILIPEIPINFDVLYSHAKKRFMKRILQSDVFAGTYLIMVAEGIKNLNGEELVDESAGVDAFGHKKLAGAGKYVCQELTKRLKNDPEISKFMKDSKMFVQKLYEVPEVREVRPGHLVRCGNSTAYDVNFGKEAGASCVLLLEKGITGVTFARISDNKIKYMKTEEAIKQRHVNLDRIVMYEYMGICFGRKTANLNFQPELIQGQIERYL
ncbi:MAG: 6-phosphofructokinase [Candidatus Omnitrophica bacterium]|nr:6-phosphofructokinase [Candidatus Omnitrophota bacterium]